MVMAAQLSGIDSGDVGRLQNLLESAGLPTKPPAVGAQAMLDAMGMDKKVQQKQIRFVLLGELGSAHVSRDIDPSRLERVLEAAD
jgi:3-dehydroquinate synthase